jgi:hypothetical protein
VSLPPIPVENSEDAVGLNLERVYRLYEGEPGFILVVLEKTIQPGSNRHQKPVLRQRFGLVDIRGRSASDIEKIRGDATIAASHCTIFLSATDLRSKAPPIPHPFKGLLLLPRVVLYEERDAFSALGSGILGRFFFLLYLNSI